MGKAELHGRRMFYNSWVIAKDNHIIIFHTIIWDSPFLFEIWGCPIIFANDLSCHAEDYELCYQRNG